MHLVDMSVGAFPSNAIVGANIPIAVGAALGFKLAGVDRVAVSFFGDGAANIGAFHEGINLAAVKDAGLREGKWQLCERTGWPDNSSYLNLGAWCWDRGCERYLVVVNLSEYRSQGHVRLPWNALAGRTWQLTDVLSGEMFERDGDELQSAGLYVDLPAWRFHFLRFQSDRNGR